MVVSDAIAVSDSRLKNKSVCEAPHDSAKPLLNIRRLSLDRASDRVGVKSGSFNLDSSFEFKAEQDTLPSLTQCVAGQRLVRVLSLSTIRKKPVGHVQDLHVNNRGYTDTSRRREVARNEAKPALNYG